MHSHVDKSQENKSHRVIYNQSTGGSGAGTALHIQDNRTEAVAQRKLQALANQYSNTQDQTLRRKPSTTGLLDPLKLKDSTVSDETVTQRYAIEREPALKRLYSVSDDREMITGMGTPNHELYIGNHGLLAQIHAATEASMLDFSIDGTHKLFKKPYEKVKVGFKRYQFTTPPEGKEKTKTHSVDLDEEYNSKIVPGIKRLTQEKFDAVMGKVDKTPWKKDFKNIQAPLNRLVRSLELFKKLVIANQAKETYQDEGTTMEAPYLFIHTIENQIYSKAALKDDILATDDMLEALTGEIKHTMGDDKYLMDVLSDCIQFAGALGKAIPQGIPVDLILIHSASYQQAMWRSMKEGTPMFYRACDVMAATVMGNRVIPQNEDQLKIYVAGGNSGAFHYAAKILASGKDWVSLESFAAGEREREILGVDDENFLMNIERSWQYMMYGSRNKEGKSSRQEDNAFELYTKLRYYLKGIKQPGGFRSPQRDRLHSTIPKDAFVGIADLDAEGSEKLWWRLKINNFFNEHGKITNPKMLQEMFVEIFVPMALKEYTPAITQKLITLYQTPSSNQRHIQAPPSNEVMNITAWLRFAGISRDEVEHFIMHYGTHLFKHSGKPRNVYNDALKDLMLRLEKI
ncbi:hypothetical protein [Parachryseolinea silvisoli]|uniref:hypothetical protein n=1 Tax=Parachryseolinea silvisoli TaxID=2873601 RepID=UPI00226596C3|nr:hypothetical protein [Parachryseolinea silvisoli]MCD9015711.1 hypothetical protein [Parachryseolinea silvisoli]